MIKQSCFQKMPNYENQKIKAHSTKNTTYGEIPNEWKVSLLKDICIKKIGVQTGPFGSQLHQKDYKQIGTPIITVEHLGENRIIHDNLPLVSDEDRDRLSRYILKKGDTVFSRVGSVDRRAFVREEEEGWLFSGRCLRVRPDPKIVDPSYLSWFFGHPNFKDYIRRIAVGATMPSLNTNLLESVEIILPSMDEQKKIASIFDSLSEKIDLNQQMNSTLEQIAQTLFKHWFIDFEFPDENKNPYKSSGDRMVDSELGEIPEGWKVKKVDEILELAYGKALKKDIRIPGNVPVYGSNGQVDWHNEKLVDGPGIVVGRKGNPGTVTWVHTNFYPIDTTFYIVPKGPVKSLYYLLYALKKQDLPSLAADSAVPGLNRNMVYMNKMIVPERNILDLFDIYLNQIFQKIQVNEEQSRVLGSIRDSLLPKLMSGKIRVQI